ncbi:hypothetical protein BVG16_14120 [Paenibacillus selenitireducens]|uniref:ATPase of the ABC class C-terminal domain-containing protein n=1 Tax=Paenibacillus selenitireducens TaxID=1324314 RepID=A0A1T2XCF7_9BACL|nr:P-loop domain-containing protein [Paenibacillus selenitireducens]OPA77579.1 hypothetical protein BVG16_14120 [Paenibacillus selenitireducens]
MQIREYLNHYHYVAFIADGSTLPRENGTISPMTSPSPFITPESLKKVIRFSDSKSICGMAIPKGITVITGGGFSGKSTMLAIEMGINNHIPGDGREFVISVDSAQKIYIDNDPYQST